MIRRALASLPAKPAMFIAPAVILLGLAYHYGTAYQRCTYHAELRERLTQAVERAAGAAAGGRVALAEITDFAWDRAAILTTFPASGRTADCPFGWDWSEAARARLAAEGLLTVIVFTRDAEVVDYLEHRSDVVAFVEIRNPYTPATAVFALEAGADDGAQRRLRPVDSGE